MTDLSKNVLSVLKSIETKRISENVLLGKFNINEINVALEELETLGYIYIDNQYVTRVIELC